ncbi:FecR family protein [Reichenbachiella ulvae]|uniref:FecR domain-containing protein n=1 Tax=Reichenbachiella ulvae TaxID=2980104 RepID=A0ABT3CS71_9BACT|nr:FecR domain-containing protein [Reichenbachiella ulvae]MCV9386560.1 FecR domain-containing protein [Reichenbachiella ulvae]
MEEVLAKYFSNELTPKERQEVEEWRNESESNAEEFLAYSKIWHSETTVDTDAALSSILDEINGLETMAEEVPNVKEPKAGQVFLHFFKIAAAVLIGVGIGYFALSQFDLLQSPQQYSSNAELMEVQLADGTIVTLSRHSTLSFLETENERLVEMDGKAFFDVKRDESKPFIIRTAYSEVEVLGTSFLVDASGSVESSVVVVESGLVAVTSKSDNTEQVELKAGERAFFEESGHLAKTTNTNINYLSWKTHLISFQSEPLEEVVQLLNENFGVEIQLSNDMLKNCVLTADFKDQEVNDILEIISLTFSLELKKLSDNRFVLSGEGC